MYVNAAWLNTFPKGFFGLSKVNLKGTKTPFVKQNKMYKANWHNLNTRKRTVKSGFVAQNKSQ